MKMVLVFILRRSHSRLASGPATAIAQSPRDEMAAAISQCRAESVLRT